MTEESIKLMNSINDKNNLNQNKILTIDPINISEPTEIFLDKQNTCFISISHLPSELKHQALKNFDIYF